MFALRLLLVPADDPTSRSAAAPGPSGNFLVLFGALDRLSGFFVLASIREFAPFVTHQSCWPAIAGAAMQPTSAS